MFNSSQQQSMNGVSSKELAYITDCLKNEDLLSKLAIHGMADSQQPQLKQKLAQIAQDRLNQADHLLRTLQQFTQIAH